MILTSFLILKLTYTTIEIAPPDIRPANKLLT